MLGMFKRKPPPDPEVTNRLKSWVSALMDLSDRDTIMLAELDCRDPGCPDFETVITVILADRRRFVLRFPGQMAGVTEADVHSLNMEPSLKRKVDVDGQPDPLLGKL